MEQPVISSGSVQPIFTQQYERYLPTAFDDSPTLLEKVNKVIVTLNQIGKLSNDVLSQWNTVMNWVENDGLTESVSNKILSLINDGTLNTIINQELLYQLNNKITNVQTSIQSMNDSKMDNNTTEISVRQINKNLGLIDESYLDSTLKQQIVGNTPISVIPSDNSITEDKLAFPVPKGVMGKNLFNKNKATEGNYVDYSTGNLVALVDSYVSDYIPILPNTNYTKINGSQYAYYDSNKIYISGQASGQHLTTPSNASFVRITIPSNYLNNEQLELGSISTSYEEYGARIDSDKLNDGSISDTKLKFIPAKLVIGKNLFNKKTATRDYYVDMNNGNLVSLPNTTFASDFIDVSANTTYTKTDNQQLAFYDNNKNYLSGVVNQYTFTTPTNCAYVRVSGLISNLNNYQLEIGLKATSFEPFGRNLDSDVIIPNYVNHKTVTVNKLNGDFATIQGAIDSILDANANFVYDIKISSGTYQESITTKDYVNLIGENKNNTIIDFVGDTSKDINSQGAVYATSTSILKNLTIKNIDGKYPIHSDKSVGNYDLIVEDCILINLGSSLDNNWTGCPFGIGLYENQNILIKNCELVGYNIQDDQGIPAVYCHNQNSDSGYRSLTIEKCIMKNVAYGVHLETLTGTLNQTNECFFYNNTIDAKVTDILYNDIDNTQSWKFHGSGNGLKRVSYLHNESYVIEEGGFTKKVKIVNGDVHKGELVAYYGANFGMGTPITQNDSPIVQGVALQDIQNGNEGIIQIKGLAMVKLSGSISMNDLLSSSNDGSAKKGTSNIIGVAAQNSTTNGLYNVWLKGN